MDINRKKIKKDILNIFEKDKLEEKRKRKTIRRKRKSNLRKFIDIRRANRRDYIIGPWSGGYEYGGDTGDGGGE